MVGYAISWKYSIIIGLVFGVSCAVLKTGEPIDDDPDTGSHGDSGYNRDADLNTTSDSSPTDWTESSTMGPGSDHPYEPNEVNSNGVSTSEDGWLELEVSEQFIRNELWIANSGEGTVSRIDANLVAEVGRYYVGMSELRADPSRTSVDLVGDVFVGNRAAPSSVSKIAADIERCHDRNGNGVIDTSTGPDDLYPRSDGTGGTPAGQSTDECVLWNRGFDPEDPDPLSGLWGCSGLRGVATTAETGFDFIYNGHVWIGCQTERAVYKLNGNTGDLMPEHSYNLSAYDCPPYGFLVDHEDRLWIACRGSTQAGVQWLDSELGSQNLIDDSEDPYGIALDGEGRIWLATWAGEVFRYTPGPEADLNGGFWEGLKISDIFRGIAVDDDGFAWVIDTLGPAEIYRIDPELFPEAVGVSEPYSLGDPDRGFFPENGNGVAIDFSGHVWGISMDGCGGNGCATRLEIDRSDSVPEVVGKDIVTVGRQPYTYSDMAGYHLRNFTTKQGSYRQRFEVCPETSTRWDAISWESYVPAGTSVVIRARTADSEGELDEAPWHSIVEVPDDLSPADLPEDLQEGHFIELEVRLYNEAETESPRVGPIGFTFECTVPLY